MSGLMDKAQQVFNNQEDKSGAQGGDGIERTADNDVNKEVNQVADDAGVPKEFDSTIDKMADKKVNDDIPGGN